MDLIKKALEFEKRKMRFPTTTDRVLASREAKSLILNLNKIYKENNDKNIMDIIKRLTIIKKRIEKG